MDTKATTSAPEQTYTGQYNIDKTSNAIEEAITKAEEQAEIEIDSAFIGITGEHVKGINCSGTITISNNEYMNPAGEKITKEDIKKVLPK